MNLITKLLSITLISFCFACSGHTETKLRSTDSIKNVFAKELKNKTLPEARAFLSGQTEQLDQLLEMMNTRIQLSISSAVKNPTGDEGVISSPVHNLIPEETIKQGMEAVVKNYGIQQEIGPKGSTLTTAQSNTYPFPDFYSNNEKNRTILNWSLDLKQLYFYDKTTAKENASIASDGDVLIETRKPIDSASASFKYSYVTKVEQFMLDKNTLSAKTPYGTIALKQLAADEATVEITGKTDHVLAIVGIDSKGRQIDQNSTSSYSLPPEGKKKILEIYNKALKAWVKNIDNNKYKSTDELVADIRKTMPAELGSEEMMAENTKVSSLHFYQNIAKVAVYYATEEKTVEQKIALKNSSAMASGNSIASGDKKGMFGIVDAAGKWIVEPGYQNLEVVSPSYFKSCINGNTGLSCKYYRFDAAQKKLTSLNSTALNGYELESALGNDYIQFYKATSPDYKGAADNNGNIVLKPVFHEIVQAGKFFITVQPNAGTDEEYAMYSLDGKVVIPVNENIIFPDNGYIFAGAATDRSIFSQRYRLLNMETGKSVLPEGTYALEAKFNSNLLLVGDATRKYYIDTKLSKKFDATAYKELGRFSDGYVKVTNPAGLRGVVNSSGKLVVPCIYEDLTPVYHDITMVTKVVNNAYQIGLLNVTSNKFVVPLVTSPKDYNSLGSNENVIYLLEGKKYNYLGEPITKK